VPFIAAGDLLERERELETLRAGLDRACWLGRVLPRINVEGAGFFAPKGRPAVVSEERASELVSDE
jgi:hypothetical protein